MDSVMEEEEVADMVEEVKETKVVDPPAVPRAQANPT